MPTLTWRDSKPLPKSTLDAAEAVLVVYCMPSSTPRRQEGKSTLVSMESLQPLHRSLYCRVLGSGVARGGDIPWVVGGLVMSSVSAFTNWVPVMAFDRRHF